MTEPPTGDPRRRRLWFIALATLAISAIVSIYTPITLLFLMVPIAISPFLFRKRPK